MAEGVGVAEGVGGGLKDRGWLRGQRVAEGVGGGWGSRHGWWGLRDEQNLPPECARKSH